MLISSLLCSLMQTGLCKKAVGWMCAHSVCTHTGLRFKESAAWLPSLFAHGYSGDNNFLTERVIKINKPLPPTLMLFFMLSKQGSWSCKLLRLFRNEKQQIGRFRGRVKKCNSDLNTDALPLLKAPSVPIYNSVLQIPFKISHSMRTFPILTFFYLLRFFRIILTILSISL